MSYSDVLLTIITICVILDVGFARPQQLRGLALQLRSTPKFIP